MEANITDEDASKVDALKEKIKNNGGRKFESVVFERGGAKAYAYVGVIKVS